LEGGENHLFVYSQNNPVRWVDPEGLEPRSTLGGDDPGFENPEEMIKELENRLKDKCLTQKEKEKIRRRIQELRRRKSNKQQHHYEETKPQLAIPPLKPEQVAPLVTIGGIVAILIRLAPLLLAL
jgi:hypothetical protein